VQLIVCHRRIVSGSDGKTLWLAWGLLYAWRLATFLKLRARYSAENTNLTPEGEPVVTCRPIKSHRYPPHTSPTVTAVIAFRLLGWIMAEQQLRHLRQVPTASTMSKLLLILVVQKYRAGASLPPTASCPSSFGFPNFAVMAFKVSIDFVTLGSA
jgi:hypothetical protein